MILLGTKNWHKVREVQAMLAGHGQRAVPAVGLPDVEETGATFKENAALKALAFAEFCAGPVLADDSGLVLPALDGDPGVRSARYAGEEATDEQNLQLLLQRIREKELHEPEAAFVCSLALALPGEMLCAVEGRVEGRIIAAPRGENGFGYDPVFFHEPSGCVFAELEPEQKNLVSHRAVALAALAQRLPELLDRL